MTPQEIYLLRSKGNCRPSQRLLANLIRSTFAFKVRRRHSSIKTQRTGAGVEARPTSRSKIWLSTSLTKTLCRYMTWQT